MTRAPARHRAGDRGALLLAAGQLVRAVAEPDPLDGRLSQPAALGYRLAPVKQAAGNCDEF